MRKPSPATVIATVALFVALGDAGMAATGGTFILGQSNSADQTTALGSGVKTGPTLELSNDGNKPAARLNTASGVQPFVVNNPTKVQNLNADLLDGIDSSGFTQGGGRLYSPHVERVPVGGVGVILGIAGVVSVSYECRDGNVREDVIPTHLNSVLEQANVLGSPFFYGPDTTHIYT